MKFNFYFSALSFKQSVQLIFRAFYSLIRISSNNNSFHRTEFENNFRRKLSLDSAIAMPSNRSGIYTLLSALNISHQDQIIVTGYTCAAVVEPILLLGATPVFVDISKSNFTISLDDIENKINKNTKVIIVQHSFGFIAPTVEILNLVRDKGVFVIEDCALALGSRQANFSLGSLGDASIWSFELSKTISVGWGGLISVRSNKELVHKIVEIRDTFGSFGRLSMARRLFQGGMSGIFYHQNMPLILTKFIFGPFVKSGIFKTSSYTRASNVKMPADYQWKILKQQFNRLNYLNDHSRFVTYQYNLVLSKIGCPIFWESAYRENVVLIRYPLIVQKPERFLNYFTRFNIEIGRWFSSPVSGANILDGFSYEEGSCPNAEWIGKHIVNLPLNSRINQNILNVISIGLKTYFDEYPEELEWIRNVNATLYK